MRSDCKFDNIDALIIAAINNSEKIICITPFFRPCSYYYCSSDFVIGTSTNEAKIVTKKLLESLQSQILPTNPAERKICFIMLSVRGLILSTDKLIATSQIHNNYYVVDVNDLKPTLYWHDCIKNIDEF
jgi:hypothetical protein